MAGKCRVCGVETKVKSGLCSKHNTDVVALNRFNAKSDSDKDSTINKMDFKLKMFRKNREVPTLPIIDVVRVVEKTRSV